MGDISESGLGLGISKPADAIYSKRYTASLVNLNKAIQEIGLYTSDLQDSAGPEIIATHKDVIKAKIMKLKAQAEAR